MHADTGQSAPAAATVTDMWWQRLRPDAAAATDPRAVRLAARFGDETPTGRDEDLTDRLTTRLLGAGTLARQVLRASGDIWIAPAGAPTPTADDVLDALALAGQALADVDRLRAELDAEARTAPMSEIEHVAAAMDPVLTAHTALEAIQAGLLATAVRLGISRETVAATGMISDELLDRWYRGWARDQHGLRPQ